MRRRLALAALVTCAAPVERELSRAEPEPSAVAIAAPDAPSAGQAPPPLASCASSLARCGGRGPGGPADHLFACRDGAWAQSERCVGGCQAFGPGAPDRCAAVLDDIAPLTRALATKPYVEERCEPAAHPVFAKAKRCRYAVMGLAAEVLVDNPDPARVVQWATDAASYVAPLDALRLSHPAAFREGVLAFVLHVKHQSSRIFPIAGEIVEDLGGGATRYGFDRGVVSPCDKGNCRCRVNSLTPGAWCRFADHLGEETRAACLERYEGTQGDERWRERCANNHQLSLDQAHNPHFRAKAFAIGERIGSRCPAGGCEPSRVVALLRKELGLP